MAGVALVNTWIVTLRGRRGTYGTGLAPVTRLVPRPRWDAAAFRVAGVALCDIHLHFVWQAWHLMTWIVTLRGRRGTYGTGLALGARDKTCDKVQFELAALTRRAQKLLVRSRPLCIFAQIMPVEKRSDGWRDTPCAGVAVGSLQLSIFAHLHRLWLLNLYLFLCSCFSWFRRDVALTSLQRSDFWNEVLAQPPRQRLKVSGALLAVLYVVMCHMSRTSEGLERLPGHAIVAEQFGGSDSTRTAPEVGDGL